jgi:uncharacterized membrane-anchored protein
MPRQSSRSPHTEAERNYRAYLIGSDGRIVLRVDLNCDDDEAAKRQAKALVDAHDIELWDGARKIAEFKTSGRTSKVTCPEVAALSRHKQRN